MVREDYDSENCEDNTRCCELIRKKTFQAYQRFEKHLENPEVVDDVVDKLCVALGLCDE
ncbi:MAG: hypothetical protein KJ718_06250 [Nanoarchaeota archaeon]|nr:hypothetical protein [Nanoarchaeota archaeon]MBU1052122.1 hypothetical protein [Nanoarchaeota archaeon]MBU1988604.1 hypothetical protein [Nanoarchaeota archaeon]